MPNHLVFQNHTFNVVNHLDQVWLSSKDIAIALGYAHDNAITMLYNKNKSEFTDSMSQVVVSTTSGNYRVQKRVFSLRGAHLVGMFARTALAKDFRRWVLDVLDKEIEQKPHTPEQKRIAKTTTEERAALRDAVHAVVSRSGSANKPEALKSIYKQIHHKFSVNHIEELLPVQIMQAISFVYNLEEETKPIEQKYSDREKASYINSIAFFLQKIKQACNDDFEPLLSLKIKSYLTDASIFLDPLQRAENAKLIERQF